jgi:hypothetical protein
MNTSDSNCELMNEYKKWVEVFRQSITEKMTTRIWNDNFWKHASNKRNDVSLKLSYLGIIQSQSLFGLLAVSHSRQHRAKHSALRSAILLGLVTIAWWWKEWSIMQVSTHIQETKLLWIWHRR